MRANRTRAWRAAMLVGFVLAPAWAAMAADAPGAASKPADDWPKWRGPNGDNVPAIARFPQDLQKGLTRLWAVADLCAGKNSAGWSCPSVVGDRLVITGRDNAKDLVVCLNAQTGQPIWRQDYDAPGPDVQYGNGPRATPAIDGDRVYTFGCMGDLACWTLPDGKLLWRVNVDKLGGKRPMWGHSSTPLVLGDRIFVMAGGQNLVLALDKKTGQKVWASPAGPAGYAALTTAKLGGQEDLLVFAGDALLALSIQSGQKRWQFGWPTAYGMNCTTPLVVGERILLGSSESGGKGGMALVQVGPDGAKAVWTNRRVGPGHNDPVVIAGHAYAYTGFSLNEKGFTCVELATGKQKWFTDQLGGPGTAVQVGGDLLCLSNRGRLALVQPAPDGLKKVSELQVFEKAYPVWTQPIIAAGRLYLRFANQLICYKIAG